MNERVLTLYARRGCALCDEMAAVLAPHLVAGNMLLHTVDIDLDPKLLARFDWEVPLLFDGEVEICRHKFNEFAFEAWLIKI